MSWTDPPDWTTETLSSADMNAYVRDNSNDLHRRTTPQTATVATSESVTISSYTDLTTPGPAVSAEIGASGMALVILTARVEVTFNDADALMSYSVSGATTVSSNDTRALRIPAATGGQWSLSFLHEGLTAGTNTFTAKYKSETGSLTSTFRNRQITVLPLGS